MAKGIRAVAINEVHMNGHANNFTKSIQWNDEPRDLIELASELELLQLKRLLLKNTRNDLEATAGLTPQQEQVFQRRFDEITEATANLASIAAGKTAHSLAQLRAKAAFLLEFVEPGGADVVDRLTSSLVNELINYLDLQSPVEANDTR